MFPSSGSNDYGLRSGGGGGGGATSSSSSMVNPGGASNTTATSASSSAGRVCSGGGGGVDSGNSLVDFSELKNLVNEMNQGLEYENLSIDGSQNYMRFRSNKYTVEFFQHLNELRENEKFCDVVLRLTSSSDAETGTTSQPSYIKAHKLVLASASAYFKAMFAGGFRETFVTSTTPNNQQQVLQEVPIDSFITYPVLKLIIDFMYTNSIELKEENVQDVLMASKVLMVDEVVNSCCVFLYMNIDPSNCIGVERLAKQLGCVTLARKAQKYATEHFCELMNSEEFLNLHASQLCSLLSKDELSVHCESIVFKAVVAWVKHDPEKRRTHLDHLFQCVRFHFLPPRFLTEQMKNNDLLKMHEADKSRAYLQKICDDLIAHKPCPMKPRMPALNFALFVIGGYQRQSINLVECLKKSTMTWEPCAEMRVPRSGVACVTFSLYIYAIGGRNNNLQGNTDCSDVECYDPFVNMWRTCAPMSVPRSRAGVAVLDGLIYACGGAYGAQYHSSVERYYNMENRWESVSPMIMPRIGLGCAVVNRLLYAIGGYDGQTRLNQVECYNPEQDVWSLRSPMHTPRSGAGVCSLDNHIYVVGGYTTNLQLNSVERYDTLTDQWSFIKPMSMPRSALASVAVYDKILAIGGYNGNEFLSSIEVYDPSEDKWTEGTRLTSERSGHGAAVTVEARL